MNVALFEKVIEAITEEPKRLDIWQWQNMVGPYANYGPACGVIGCIAGWGDILSHTEGNKSVEAIKNAVVEIREEENERLTSVRQRAQEAFEITREEAGRLFAPQAWPEDLQQDLNLTTPGTPEHANAVVKAIRQFIDDPDKFSKFEED